jgi:hypothetical protein
LSREGSILEWRGNKNISHLAVRVADMFEATLRYWKSILTEILHGIRLLNALIINLQLPLTFLSLATV